MARPSDPADVPPPPVDPELQLLQAVADPTRLGIVRELSGATEVCACDFASRCGVSQPTASHHLRVLREAGVVRAERRGTWIWYSLAPDAGERLAKIARGMIPGGFVPLASLGRAAKPVSRSVHPGG